MSELDHDTGRLDAVFSAARVDSRLAKFDGSRWDLFYYGVHNYIIN